MHSTINFFANTFNGSKHSRKQSGSSSLDHSISTVPSETGRHKNNDVPLNDLTAANSNNVSAKRPKRHSVNENTLKVKNNDIRSKDNISIVGPSTTNPRNDHYNHDNASAVSKQLINNGSADNNTASSTRDSASLSDPDELDFPEGGLRAWLCVLGSFLGLTNCFGTINSVSAIETYIAHNQLANVSASVIGWVFSIYMCVALLFGVFTGHLFDTQGPRIPIIMGTVLTFAGVFAMGNCHTIWQFILAFGVVAGLGTAVQMSALVGIISHYFYKRRGIAIGLSTIGGSVGGAVFPIMLRKLYSSVGFVWASRIFGFLLAFLDLCALVLITPRFPPRKTLSDKKMSIWQKTGNFFAKTLDLEAFKDPRFTFCTLAVTFSEVFLVTSMTYYGSYALFVGNSQDTAYLLITVLNATGVVARAAAGYGSDKLGKYNVMTGMVFFASLFCLIIWLPFGHHTGGLYAFSVLYGIASAAVLSLTPLCVSQISRVEDFGRKYATCYFVVALGTLIGIPISGLFIGGHGTSQQYDNFIIFVSVLGFVGVLFWVISRWFAVRFKLCVY